MITSRNRVYMLTSCLTTVVLVCKYFIVNVIADPVAPCVTYGKVDAATTSLFVADTIDRCSFHWCIAGRWLQTEPFVCPVGTAVKRRYIGTANPCTANTVDVNYCLSHSQSTSHTDTAVLRSPPGLLDEDGFPQDHHPATLTWKVIDLTAEQHRQQQQPAASTPQQLRYLRRIKIGDRDYIAGARVTRNVRISGGDLVLVASTLSHCWKACLSHDACRGFDFDAESTKRPATHAKCFLHDQNSICNRYEYIPGFNNYRFQTCVTDWSNRTTWTTNSVSDAVNYLESVPGHHVPGGQLQEDVRTATDCVSRCLQRTRRRRSNVGWQVDRRDARCVAVDFDSTDNTCWIHSPTTGCVTDTMLQPMSTSTHYRVRRHICDNLKGYVVPSVHSLGGEYQSNIGDVMTCYRVCAMSFNCSAVDFDNADNSCWFHAGPGTCDRLHPATSTLQIRRRRDCSLPS